MAQLQLRKTRAASYPFDSYLSEINETSLLDAAAERELAYRVADGDSEARDHMVRANLRLVVSIAKSYRGKGLPIEDLIAEGNLGLLRAVEGFDPSMNTRFSTYASYWIKQSIKRAVVNTAKTVRLPNYMTDLLTKWHRATAELADKLGRPPLEDEIASHLSISGKKLAIIKKAIRVHAAGLQVEHEGAGPSLAELCPDDVGRAPETSLMERDDLRHVLGLLERMDERAATVLRLRFGLGDEEPMTLAEIGSRLGYTRERVRQIEHDALAKLREAVLAE